MTTATYLNDLITAKNDMKSALIEKGVTPAGGLSTYADAIREIQWRQEKIRYGYNKWEICPYIDISEYTSLDNMFRECVNLVEGPVFDTKDINDFSYMFYGCVNLTSVPLYDTSKAHSVYGMFEDCVNLTSVPFFDLSNVADVGFLFCDCSSLTSVPLYDTSKATRFVGTFWGCTSLTELPQFNMHNVEDIEYICQDCSSLTSVPLLDFCNVKYARYAFSGCSNLVNLGGFKDLGMTKLNDDSFSLSSCSKLTYDSIMNVINNLYDISTSDSRALTLKLSSASISKLSDGDIAIATNKGWVIA